MSTDGGTLLFFSNNRDTPPMHKTFVTVLQPDGTFSPAAPIDELNTDGALTRDPM